jgi:Peptidase family M28/PDZ domain/PA domain
VRRPLLLLPLLAILAACGPAAAPLTPPPPLPPEPAWTAAPATPARIAIDPDPAGAARIAADVTYLASPELAGRGTGEDGGRLAADFLVKRFRDLGLAPLGDNGERPDDRRYLQAFSARVGAKVQPAELRELRETPRGKVTSLDAIPAVVADGSQSAQITAKTVFVGHGITAPAVGWDDYAGADVAGKIVVVLDGAPKLPAGKPNPGEPAPDKPALPPRPADALRDFGAVRYKLRTAREHKAAGVVIVTKGDLPPAPNDPSSMGLPGVVVTLAAAKPLLAGAGVDKRAWDADKPQKARALKAELSLGAKIDPLEAAAWNVIGLLPAAADSKGKDEYVVVGAHYDHLGKNGSPFSRAPGVRAVHPGADDNASGTALMLEVARTIGALPRRPLRNVIFMAFGAEEIGAIGSRFWVDHPTVPLEQVTAMLNADMVGRLRDGRVIVDGTGTAAGWTDRINAAAEGLDLDLALGAEGFGASDHTSFTASRIPVAFFFTGVHDDYHLPSDTADKINSAGEEKVATLAARLAFAVADAPDRMAFVDPPADPHRGGVGGGFKVSLGTIPDYAFQGKGVRLTGVRPDAPAARAGMAAGDVIVKVGSHEVTNIHDYMYALGDLEAGREVVVEVDRAGARVAIKVIPAPGR